YCFGLQHSLFRQRENCNLSYAGDITCMDCWNALEEHPDAQLIDVRTSAEWIFVGFPVLDRIGKATLMVEWQQYPAMQVNSDFVSAAVEALDAAGADKNARIYTLCRSGVRSISAAQALTQAGYGSVYNVLGGFEGNPNETGHRGTVSGWKHDGLPWKQQ
ncbi:MAG: rhodanese-like domain-containing protein, partial [Pseudomonadota bacterium]